MTKLIFEKSRKDRRAYSLAPLKNHKINIDAKFLRNAAPILPEVSELEVVRHYTRLSQKNFSVDTHFYPLGSCTMKYNPHILQNLSTLNGFTSNHPSVSEKFSQGMMQCLFEAQEYLKEITGFQGVSLTPSAGAQGEFAGVSMIYAYHEARGDKGRVEMIVPDAAHGTNPASATMYGYTVREIPTLCDGDIDIEALKNAVGPQTAGILLTNPSTLGVFERKIKEISKIIHDAGGLLYYDGANLNAILGKARPGDMGFDVMHMNLHKTFGTPHGGGGPGSGPVAVNNTLLPFLPIPMVGKKNDLYIWLTEKDCPQTIGRLSAFAGNIGIVLRAYIYIRLLGAAGLKRVGEYSTLNSNYLLRVLQKLGFTAAYPDRLAPHEFIITLIKEAKEFGITAKDFGKRLLDYGVHAPTTYFPALVPECFLIEPTETESKQEIDAFAEIMAKILAEIKTNSDLVKGAPYTMPVKRLDDVKAAKDMDFMWRGQK
ncbi:MAG: aminomethyl-transferring glycine dehydrogenase subunit GcvPB [Gammaproteobacteria bacterium]|nr:aminomethyl-transferring glycine dehydrogenase subunit GcvPB [Gammaproteobacteria bacterium]